MGKELLNMAIGGVIVAAASFVSQKIAGIQTKNETFNKFKNYIAPLVVVVIGIALGFVKVPFIKNLAMWFGAAGFGLLITEMVTALSTKPAEAPAE